MFWKIRLPEEYFAAMITIQINLWNVLFQCFHEIACLFYCGMFLAECHRNYLKSTVSCMGRI